MRTGAARGDCARVGGSARFRGALSIPAIPGETPELKKNRFPLIPEVPSPRGSRREIGIDFPNRPETEGPNP